MVGYITNKFKIEGVKDDINDDTFGIWVSCNCCGNKRYYTIKDGKAKMKKQNVLSFDIKGNIFKEIEGILKNLELSVSK